MTGNIRVIDTAHQACRRQELNRLRIAQYHAQSTLSLRYRRARR
jgi:hypothetical protein